MYECSAYSLLFCLVLCESISFLSGFLIIFVYMEQFIYRYMSNEIILKLTKCLLEICSSLNSKHFYYKYQISY